MKSYSFQCPQCYTTDKDIFISTNPPCKNKKCPNCYEQMNTYELGDGFKSGHTIKSCLKNMIDSLSKKERKYLTSMLDDDTLISRIRKQ